MDGFEEIFKKCAKNLFVHLSKLLYNVWICNGTECYYKVVSIFEHFNVYEDILNKCLLSQVKKSQWWSIKCNFNAMEFGIFYIFQAALIHSLDLMVIQDLPSIMCTLPLIHTHIFLKHILNTIVGHHLAWRIRLATDDCDTGRVEYLPMEISKPRGDRNASWLEKCSEL